MSVSDAAGAGADLIERLEERLVECERLRAVAEQDADGLAGSLAAIIPVLREDVRFACFVSSALSEHLVAVAQRPVVG